MSTTGMTGTTAGTAHRHAPAGTGPGTIPVTSKSTSFTDSSSEVKALVQQLNNLASAQTYDEHTQALTVCDEDLTLDTPFLQVQGRDRIRALSTFYKFFLGKFKIEPRMVRIVVPEGPTSKGGKIEVDSIVHWLPNRPWFVPVTLLLPRDVPIYADVSLGVKAHNDKVFYISGKNHNLPHVPRVLRLLAGYVLGTAAAVAEPAYHTLMGWYRAGMEGAQNASTAVASSAQKGTDYVKDEVTSAIDTVKTGTGAVVDKLTDTAAKVTNTVGATHK